MSLATCPKCGAKNRIDPQKAQTLQPVCGRCGTKLSISAVSSNVSHPLEVTDANFQSILNEAGDKPILIDCWADWCGPCKMLTPTIEALASESNGRWIIAKLDVDQNQRVASTFNVSSIPTMLIFKNGQLKDQLVGLQSKQAIESRLARI